MLFLSTTYWRLCDLVYYMYNCIEFSFYPGKENHNNADWEKANFRSEKEEEEE